MKKHITGFTIFLIAISGLMAQPEPPKEPGLDQPYYQFMIFRMTEDLKLTPEQAEKLFPLNRPYREEKQKLHFQMNILSDEVYQKKEITKDDLEKYRKEIVRLHQAEQALDDQFFNEVETFLSPEQVAKLIFFDPHFRRELSHELKQRYMPKPDEKKGKNKFWNKKK